MPLWLTKLPWNWIGVGLLGVTLIASALAIIDRAFDQTKQAGKLEERSEQLEQTIENVKDADNAREEINNSSPAGNAVRYEQCLRTARTPANCDRWMPDIQAD